MLCAAAAVTSVFLLSGCRKDELRPGEGDIAELNFTMNGLSVPGIWGAAAVSKAAETKAGTQAPMPADAQFEVRVYGSGVSDYSATSPSYSGTYKVTQPSSGATQAVSDDDKISLPVGTYDFCFVYPASFTPNSGVGSVGNGTDFMAVKYDNVAVAPDFGGTFHMNVKFARLCSRFDIVISPASGAAIKTLALATDPAAKLSGIAASATYKLGEAALTVSGNDGTFEIPDDAFTVENNKISTQNGIVILPLLASNNHTLKFEISLLVDNVPVTTEVSIPNAELAAGYKRTLNLTIDHNGEATYTVFTTEWNTYSDDWGGMLTEKVTDLSAEETANCYMVSEPGTLYKFNAKVMGNGTAITTNPDDFHADQRTNANQLFDTDPIFNGSKELNPKEAFIIWSTGSSLNDIITDVKLLDDGYVQFRTAAGDALTQGNAVIGVKDASGNLIWSWHIWATDYTEADAVHYDASSGILIGNLFDGISYYGEWNMMDRNLGALNKTEGDIGSTGLLYQWGRKDPIIGSSKFDYSGFAESDGEAFHYMPDNVSETNYDWSVVEVSDVVGNDKAEDAIKYSIENPTKFILGKDTEPFDWLGVTSYAEQRDWLWGNPNPKTGDINDPDNPATKSIYDPCPPGYKIPQQHIWGLFVISNYAPRIPSLDPAEYNGTKVDFGCAFNVSYPQNGITSYYPAAGYRAGRADGMGYWTRGGIYDVGAQGAYWSAAPRKSNLSNNTYEGAHFYFKTGGYSLIASHGVDKISRDYALSVRCVRDDSSN